MLFHNTFCKTTFQSLPLNILFFLNCVDDRILRIENLLTPASMCEEENFEKALIYLFISFNLQYGEIKYRTIWLYTDKIRWPVVTKHYKFNFITSVT